MSSFLPHFLYPFGDYQVKQPGMVVVESNFNEVIPLMELTYSQYYSHSLFNPFVQVWSLDYVVMSHVQTRAASFFLSLPQPPTPQIGRVVHILPVMLLGVGSLLVTIYVA